MPVCSKLVLQALTANNYPISSYTIKAILNHQNDHLIKRQTVTITTTMPLAALVSFWQSFWHKVIFTTACRSAGALVILIVVPRWPPEHPNHPDNLKDPDNPGLFEKGATVKVENFHWGQSGPALQKTPKQSFSQSPHPRCKYLPNIFIL